LELGTRNTNDWMRRAPVFAAIGLFLLGGSPRLRAQCDSLKSGERVWVRLLTPLASSSGKAGEKVKAMVIASPDCGGSEIIPIGSEAEGEVLSAQRVGMGLVHETAKLKVEFRKLKFKDGSETEISARIVEIDNARETLKGGVIHGVNAMDTPQGRITSRLRHLPTWNPYSDVTLLALRTAFPMFPEPEIYLPRGSDLKLEMTTAVSVPQRAEPNVALNAPDEMQKALMGITIPELPGRTTTKNGRAADIVNVALLGTATQMNAAFRAAGWKNGDAMSMRSVMKQAHAFFSFNNYATAPITTQLLYGQRVDTTWEKGLDSYAKREHLRVWGRTDLIEGQTVWVGAMTRETGATLSFKRHKFIHHIDADMDDARTMMVRDLALAGCVADVYYVERPQVEHFAMNSTGDPMRTDGALAVVQLKDCENAAFEQVSDQLSVQTRPRSKFARYLRMQVLSYRSDLIRGNIVYGAFDLTRMAIRARRNRVEKALLATPAEMRQEHRPTVPTGNPSGIAGFFEADPQNN